MVLVYSARLRRRAVTRPGSGLVLRSWRSNSAVRDWTISSIFGGAGAPLGGLSRARVLRGGVSQPSRVGVGVRALVKGARLTPPEERFGLWHGAHVLVSMGATVFSNVGASAAVRQATEAHRRMATRISLPKLPSDGETLGVFKNVTTWRGG